MRPFLIVMAVSVIATALSVPPIRALSRRVGAMAEPGDRTVHARPTPVLGGTSLLIGVLAGLGVAALLPEFRPVFDTPINVLGIVAAAVVMWLTGLVDDLRDVSAPAKVAGMVLSGSILTLVGLTVIYFRVPFVGFTVLPPDLSALVSVLWVVGMANAVNLIDGLDGLAAGIVTIASGAFFLYGWRLLDVGVLDPSNVGPLVAIVTAGVCLGFLPVQLQPGQHLHGRQRRPAAGAAPGRVDHRGGRPVGRPVLGPVVVLLRPVGHPAVHPGRARCWTRCSPSSGVPPVAPGWPRRTRSTCTTGSWTWATATVGRW